MTKVRSLKKKESDKSSKKETSSKKDNSKKTSNQYRSNLLGIQSLISGLHFRRRHKNSLQKTPFWFMYKRFMKDDHVEVKTRKQEHVIRDVVSTYDESKGCFVLGKKRIQLTDNDITLIFGVVSGPRTMKIGRNKKPVDVPFVDRRFGNSKNLKSTNIKAAIQQALEGEGDDDADDVARLMMLHTCLSLFFSTRADHIPWAFIKFVNDLDNVKMYNWSKAISDNLMDSIKKYKKSPDKVAGCVTVLSYWFCEHTNVFNPVHSSMFPRFLKWDLKGWPNDFKTKHIRCLHFDQVIDCNLIMTEKERAAIDRQRLDSESESEDDSTSISSESNQVPSASSNSSSSNQNVNSQPTEGSISAITKLNEALLTIDRLEKERDEAKQESQKLKHDNVEHEKQIAQMHGELEELRKSLLREKELKNMLNSDINFAIDSDNQSYENNAAGVGEKEDVIKVADNDYSKALVIRGDVSPIQASQVRNNHTKVFVSSLEISPHPKSIE
ncbi:uncharacterized protein LOC119998558 [Tripterygium wilfordii]|uniref:uncharacterized protein LOC119998558 n=1 Tax=Tripterygium wilfordii TaxID=458696 RepID=UPI0018F808CF|nr:uncharacterized protein LOC119998558 [Tripterygium wilfordii]